MRRTADPAPPVVAAGRKPSRDKWLEIPSLRYIPNGIRHLRRYGLLATASRIIPPLRSYRAWIRGYDTLRARDIAAIRQRIASMRERPLISVLLPVPGPPGPLLRRALASVAGQLYPEWELCVAGEADPADVPKQRVKQVPAGPGMADAVNAALAVAAGEFVLVLRPDDVLPPHALYVLAAALETDPDADIVYSDEDTIDRRGRRQNPHFKSDWNLDLFLGQAMTGDLTAYRRSLFEQLGGMRTGLDGAEAFDLALRAAEITGPGRIRHIPAVLYHRAAAAPGIPPEARRQVVAEHFDRTEAAAKATTAPDGGLRVRHRLADPLPGISLIVPTRDQVPLLRRCVEGLLRQTDYPELEVVIVDNDSVEPDTRAYFAELAAEPRVCIFPYPHAFNYSAINNFAVARCRNPLIGLVNNDIEVIHPDWLREMVSHALRLGIGAVGAKLYYPDNRVQHAGTIVGLGGAAGHVFRFFPRSDPGYFGRLVLTQELSAVTAACMVLRREVFEEVGGFDEQNLVVAFNDVDLCLRIREAGYRIVWTPFAELYHWESVSRGSDFTAERYAQFRGEADYLAERWAAIVAHDPYYNPNLTIHSEDCALAFPPRVTRPWRALPFSGHTLRDK